MKRKNNPPLKTGFLLVALLLMLTGITSAQTTVLSVDAFINQVRSFHPVARQANLVTEAAAASLLAARGNFDPVGDYYSGDKTFDGTSYYRYNNAELKIPTTIGIGLKAGIESSQGQYINPESTKGVASYLGVEIPLLSGLLIDKKRAVLQQAKIYQEQSEQERLTMINDLLFDAYTAYWQWNGSYRMYNTLNFFVQNATRRFQLVKVTYANGDRAMADTIEAFAQLQNFKLMQSDALIEVKNQALNLSQYLWNENGDPYLLPDSFIPDSLAFDQLRDIAALEEIVKTLQANHPELRTYQYKLENLEVERRLKFQSLLPVLNVQANALSKDYFAYKGFSNAYLENNYKYGITMRMPLLLRQGRGDYRNAQIKIKQTGLMRNDKLWQLQNKVGQYYNEATIRREQLSNATGMYRSYAALLKNEELKFSQGESSLFLVNSREIKTLETQQKLIELRVKYLKSVYAIDWASGSLR